MTTERRGLFVLKTDDTGTKCAAECPHTEPVKGHWCDLFGPIHGQRRPMQCIAAESAAGEAEVDALRRGFDIAESEVFGDDSNELIYGRLAAQIERIRRGES